MSACCCYLERCPTQAVLCVYIGAALKQQPHNVRISLPGRQMQRSTIFGISGIRICAILEKHPSDFRASIVQCLMQRCRIDAVLGVRIRAMFEEDPSNFRMAHSRCRTQRSLAQAKAPSGYVLRVLDDQELDNVMQATKGRIMQGSCPGPQVRWAFEFIVSVPAPFWIVNPEPDRKMA